MNQWVSRQDGNDRLLTSIHRGDVAVVGVGIGAAACLLGAALVPYLLPAEPAARAGDKEVSQGWGLLWR